MTPATAVIGAKEKEIWPCNLCKAADAKALGHQTASFVEGSEELVLMSTSQA